MAQEETLGPVVPTFIYLHPAWTKRGSVSLNNGTSSPFQPHTCTPVKLCTLGIQKFQVMGGGGARGAWNPHWKSGGGGRSRVFTRPGGKGCRNPTAEKGSSG